MIILLLGFIFLFQTIIIILYMFAKKRINKHLYNKWVIERYNLNSRDYRDDRDEIDNSV